jgi:hypothetical protein
LPGDSATGAQKEKPAEMRSRGGLAFLQAQATTAARYLRRSLYVAARGHRDESAMTPAGAVEIETQRHATCPALTFVLALGSFCNAANLLKRITGAPRPPVQAIPAI